MVEKQKNSIEVKIVVEVVLPATRRRTITTRRSSYPIPPPPTTAITTTQSQQNKMKINQQNNYDAVCMVCTIQIQKYLLNEII